MGRVNRVFDYPLELLSEYAHDFHVSRINSRALSFQEVIKSII
jgi:hypothetical protein